MRFGYFLSCEEYSPVEIVEQAVAAERAGFEALWISDHYHPWNGEQGNSPFVWGVIGALSQACSLPVTTAVTCPTVRVHPAVIAQAAATAAVQLRGRFTLGVGTGEALNEHVLGDVWPSVDVRLEMLEEAVDLIRELWTGEVVTRRGPHYTVDHAHRLWSNSGLPGELAQELPTPQHFERASQLVTREATADSTVAGPDVDRHVAQLQSYVDAGYDEVYVANMGPHYLAMIEAYGRDVLPRL